MKVELHINGALQVSLVPETKLERAMLDEMAESANKGRAVKLSCLFLSSEIPKYTFSVEA